MYQLNTCIKFIYILGDIASSFTISDPIMGGVIAGKVTKLN